MRWLLTVRNSADLNQLATHIKSCGGEQDEHNEPVPLGDSEVVLQITGSAETAEQLKQVPDVLDVYPSSDMELY